MSDAVVRNRCAWVANGERCRFVGTISHGQRGEGELFCREHFQPSNIAHAQRVLEESIKEVPIDYDYSSAAIVRRTLERYLASWKKRS